MTDDLAIPAFLDRRPRPIEWTYAALLPSRGAVTSALAGEVSASYADGGVESHTAGPMTPPSATTPTPPRLRQGGEESAPYTTALLLKLSRAIEAVERGDGPVGLAAAADIAEHLLAHGIALVDTSRTRCWIDERVYAGVLFRARLQREPPSFTLEPSLWCATGAHFGSDLSLTLFPE